jgi:alpha-galactosidase
MILSFVLSLALGAAPPGPATQPGPTKQLAGTATQPGSVTQPAGATKQPSSTKPATPSVAATRPAPASSAATRPVVGRKSEQWPGLHPPRVVGATVGRALLFRVSATGRPPLTFSAEGLPEGITIDAATGILSGRASTAGTWLVEITAKNRMGRSTALMNIEVGPRKVALTPPMGWSSLGAFGVSVDETKIRAAADLLVSTGLASKGFHYVLVEDGWQGGRNEKGEIQPGAGFPDMGALAAHLHSRGLKLGLVASAGPKSCSGREGSYLHEEEDALTFARWGVDLLRYDWCSYGDVAGSELTQDARERPFRVMRAALDGTDRDIVYGLGQGGEADVSAWGPLVGANFWRTAADLTDTWQSVASVGFDQGRLAPFAAPGGWNDPGLLMLGRTSAGGEPHLSRLSPHEQMTQLTLWSMLAAPLILGGDLASLDEHQRLMLTNHEVIEVNQDSAGRQATRRTKSAETEVWSRPLSDSTAALALFNRGSAPAAVTVRFADLGIQKAQPVRNLWLRSDLGAARSFTATVAPHGAVLLKVGRPRFLDQR